MPPPRRHIQLLTTRGINLLEIMVGLSLTAGLLLIDLQRQENNMITTKKQMTKESIGSFKNTLQSWLQQNWTMESTLRINRATVIRAENPDAQPTNNNMIESLVVNNPDGGPDEIVLRQGTLPEGTPGGTPGTEIDLIGYRDDSRPGGIRSIDHGSGWAYIQSMWVENFAVSNQWESNTNGDATTTTTYQAGSANLKIRIWKYTNLIEKPGLNCELNNNCETQTLTMPIPLTLISASAEPGVDTNTPPPEPVDTPGAPKGRAPKITCTAQIMVPSPLSHHSSSSYCLAPKFFSVISEVTYNNANGACQNLFAPLDPYFDPTTASCLNGKCCQRAAP